MAIMIPAAGTRFLIVRTDARLCALPLEQVAETLRPLPIEPLAAMPPCVLGVSVIRGISVRVIDAALLLGARRAAPGRYVTVKLGAARRVALAVDGVIGVRELPEASLGEVPPLLREANADAISAISALDGELLLVLQAARLIPEQVWSVLESGGAKS